MTKKKKLREKEQNCVPREKRKRKIKDKIAVILRGIPGSGKSSFASFLNSRFLEECRVHSVDDLHTSEGVFSWDESKAEALYHLNFSNFVKSLSEGFPLVVCDCINLEVSDFQIYLDASRAFGYNPYVVTPDMPTPDISEKRNLHGVTKEQIYKMIDRWEQWPIKSLESHN